MESTDYDKKTLITEVQPTALEEETDSDLDEDYSDDEDVDENADKN
jgi:hypothetical protein